MSYDIDALRASEYPWAARGDAIYLNNASTGALPVRTLRAVEEFHALRAEPWKMTDEKQFGILRRTRELAAAMIGAGTDEIACMSNTTYGINLAARCLPLASGDVVLTFDREFPANVYPWMALAKRGVTLTRIPTRDKLPDEDALLAAMNAKNVKAVAIGWVNFATGYKADLVRIGKACRERGIYFVVDAMQGLGAAYLDARACNIDILACGGQKWLLGPWGSGFTYVRRELVRELEPEAVGWMAMRASEDFTRLVDYEFAYHDDARRFEVITVPFQDFAGLNASLEMLAAIGFANVEAHAAELVGLAVEWAQSRKDMRLVTPADPARRAGIVSIAPPDPKAVSARLLAAKVIHSLREGAIRLSPHCYNTRAEMTRALELLGG